MIAKILSGIIIGLRPLLGPANCRFEPTCTPYAINQLKTQSVLVALKNIVKRIISCRPF